MTIFYNAFGSAAGIWFQEKLGSYHPSWAFKILRKQLLAEPRELPKGANVEQRSQNVVTKTRNHLKLPETT